MISGVKQRMMWYQSSSSIYTFTLQAWNLHENVAITEIIAVLITSETSDGFFFIFSCFLFLFYFSFIHLFIFLLWLTKFKHWVLLNVTTDSLTDTKISSNTFSFETVKSCLPGLHNERWVLSLPWGTSNESFEFYNDLVFLSNESKQKQKQ